MSNLRGKLKWYILGTLFLAAILVWLAVWETKGAGRDLKIVFFDIGQGDAIFIEAPNGNQVLIDGGPDKSVLAKLGKAMPFWDRSLDLLVLTHPHLDHIAGLIEVLKRYRVGAVLTTPAQIKTAAFSEFLKITEEKNIPIYYAKKGTVVNFGNSAGSKMLALSAGGNFGEFGGDSDSFGEKGKILNESSIVGLLALGKTKILLTGDVGVETEKNLIASGVGLSADILKIGHHGSRYSTSEEFLEAVSPAYAVISAGAKNRYGHPAPEILERLENFGIKIFRTDEDGDVAVKTDGEKLFAKSER